jgi:hypothetical protein
MSSLFQAAQAKIAALFAPDDRIALEPGLLFPLTAEDYSYSLGEASWLQGLVKWRLPMLESSAS